MVRALQWSSRALGGATTTPCSDGAPRLRDAGDREESTPATRIRVRASLSRCGGAGRVRLRARRAALDDAGNHRAFRPREICGKARRARPLAPQCADGVLRAIRARCSCRFTGSRLPRVARLAPDIPTRPAAMGCTPQARADDAAMRKGVASLQTRTCAAHPAGNTQGPPPLPHRNTHTPGAVRRHPAGRSPGALPEPHVFLR